MNTGMVHVYTGNGKGKTTAALGLAMRARGAGLSVCAVQFLKTSDCGELESLKKLGVDVIRDESVSGFFHLLSSEERKKLKTEVQHEFKMLEALLPKYDVVIADEIFGTLDNGFIGISDIARLIRKKPKGTELILTGRHAPLCVIELADYVSEISPVKHPMNSGLCARKGIEF